MLQVVAAGTVEDEGAKIRLAPRPAPSASASPPTSPVLAASQNLSAEEGGSSSVNVVIPRTPILQIGDRVNRPMSKKKAHQHLKELRAQMAADGRITEESRDLSDGQIVDWQAYVTSRPDHDEIIGPGIWKFECRFLEARDPNWKQLPAPNRFDFIAHRVDGSAVRLHPEAVRHGAATRGNLSDWALRAADDNGPSLDSRAQVWLQEQRAPAVARNDTVGAFTAQVWLQEHVSEPSQDSLDYLSAASRDAGLRQPTDCVNFQDLSDQKKFPWHQFLAAREWGRMILDDVVEFGAAWWIRGPCIGPVFIVTISTEAREHANQSGVIRCNGEKAKICWLDKRLRGIGRFDPLHQRGEWE